MNQPTLRFLATKNYKNLYLDAPIYLNNLNIFIGSNGSGKSNFISCLKFLKDCLTAIPDENRGVSSFEDAVSKIGGNRILDSNVESPAKVRLAYCFSQLSQSDDKQKYSVILDLKLYTDKQKRRASISEEYLYRGESLYDSKQNLFGWPPLYYYKFHEKKSGEGVIYVSDNIYNLFESNLGTLDNITTNSLGLFLIPSLLENSSVPHNITPAYKIRIELIELISKWQFYNANNMDLNLVRTAEPKIGPSDIYLSPSGHNLALVLENLSNQNIDFEESINLAMKSILPKTRRVRAIRSGRLSLTVEWYFEGMNEPFYLDEMSDGTVRMLCWATILHSPLLSSLLVIDEPELGLHVSWMQILAEWIKKAATKTQIIIITHSPDLLDNFTDCLENVLCFYSENKTHFSIKNLSKEMLTEKLEEGWQLGDLYRVGDPTVGGWPW